MAEEESRATRKSACRLHLAVATAVIAAGLLLGMGCSGEAEVESSGPPGDAAPSALSSAQSDSLAEAFQAELDRLYQEAQRTDENFPGATAAFILADGRVFGFSTGLSDVDDEIPMTKDLRMPSGSIGKTYVAAVALELAQRGRLALDAPLESFLGQEPWFSRLPNGQDLTLRVLLTHTGGMIQPYFEDPDFAAELRALREREGPDRYLSPVELIDSVLDHEPLFEAGKGYHYSDISYILAGLAIEQATGERYYDLLDQLFLDPLDLDFTLAADRRDLPGLAQGYAHESRELFGTPLEVVDNGLLAFHPLGEWTGGGLVNNPQDLARWAQLLYRGEAITGDDLPQLLEIGFAPDPARPKAGYGLGVFVDRLPDHGPVYGHSGFFPGYNSRVVYFPDFGVAVALQINSDKSQVSRHTMALAEVVLNAVPRSSAAN